MGTLPSASLELTSILNAACANAGHNAAPQMVLGHLPELGSQTSESALHVYIVLVYIVLAWVQSEFDLKFVL